MNFANLSQEYNLTIEFLMSMYDRTVDKENFVDGVKMFANGVMPYVIATGTDPIYIGKLKQEIADNFIAQEQARAEKEKNIKKAAYKSLRKRFKK